VVSRLEQHKSQEPKRQGKHRPLSQRDWPGQRTVFDGAGCQDAKLPKQPEVLPIIENSGNHDGHFHSQAAG